MKTLSASKSEWPACFGVLCGTIRGWSATGKTKLIPERHWRNILCFVIGHRIAINTYKDGKLKLTCARCGKVL